MIHALELIQTITEARSRFIYLQIKSEGTDRIRTRNMPVVIYTATVRDSTGRQRKFDFEHSLTDSEFSDALQHKQDVGFFGRISSEHNADIIAAETWMCTGKDGCEKQATTLLNTPASCLNQTPPRVIDMCPIPICDDPECSRIAKTKTKSMLTKLAENLLAEAKPPSSDEAAATNSAGQPDKGLDLHEAHENLGECLEVCT
ncbi:hypothetical protein CYMTET_40596 [Cymbomonas tetramitiformis]|uniref:Uncharacterized protein n=1 Tax=Cymbomonas tetramitiformis TaxID=36881 RepID=A0AAE0C7R9_9CHLO|nr:hypothetical protein CYMTET_40596 [Cymbomonas tetramitiformis]